MPQRWAYSFNANLTYAESAAWEGFGTSNAADTPTNVTTAAALSAPNNGPGDTHVATVDNSAELICPKYLGQTGRVDKGVFCFRMKWVSGAAIANTRLFALTDEAGTNLFTVEADRAGAVTRIQTSGTTSVVQGSLALFDDVTYDVAIVYDYTLETPTIAVYVNGTLDISATDTASATVGFHKLGSHGGLMAYNSLRYYSDPIADLVEASKTNVWMEVRTPDTIESQDAGWTQVGSPASDLAALQSDLTTGLERTAEGEIVVSFEEPTFWGAVQAVAVFALGTSVDLQGIVEIDDSSGHMATGADDGVIADDFAAFAITTADSSGAALALGGTEGAATLDYTATLTVGEHAAWTPFYPLTGAGIAFS